MKRCGHQLFLMVVLCWTCVLLPSSGVLAETSDGSLTLTMGDMSAITDPTLADNVTFKFIVETSQPIRASGSIKLQMADPAAKTLINLGMEEFKYPDTGKIPGDEQKSFEWTFAFSNYSSRNLFTYKQALQTMMINASTRAFGVTKVTKALLRMTRVVYEPRYSTFDMTWADCPTHCSGQVGGWIAGRATNKYEAERLLVHLWSNSTTTVRRFFGVASGDLNSGVLCWRSDATYNDNNCQASGNTSVTLAGVTGSAVDCRASDPEVGAVFCPLIPASSNGFKTLLARPSPTRTLTIETAVFTARCMCTRWLTQPFSDFLYTGPDMTLLVVLSRTATASTLSVTPPPIPTPTLTSPTLTATPSSSVSATLTVSRTNTLTATLSPSASTTLTVSGSDTPPPTVSPTLSQSGRTATASQSRTGSPSASATLTLPLTPSATFSRTDTHSRSLSFTRSLGTPSTSWTISMTATGRTPSRSGSGRTASASMTTTGTVVPPPTPTPSSTMTTTYSANTATIPATVTATMTVSGATRSRSGRTVSPTLSASWSGPPPTTTTSLSRSGLTPSGSGTGLPTSTVSTSRSKRTVSATLSAVRTSSRSLSPATPTASIVASESLSTTWSQSATASESASFSASPSESVSRAITDTTTIAATESNTLTETPEITLTPEVPPLLVIPFNQSVPYAPLAFQENRSTALVASEGRVRLVEFSRSLLVEARNGGFLRTAVEQHSYSPQRHDGFCHAFDETLAENHPLRLFLEQNSTLVLTPEDVNGTGLVVSRILLQFRGFDEDTRRRLFGPNPTNDYDAAEYGSPQELRVSFTQQCMQHEATAFNGPFRMELMPPPPRKFSILDRAKTAEEIAVTAVAVVGVLSGATIAAQVSRTSFTIGLLECRPDPETVNWIQNPFDREIGEGPGAFWAGAALFDVVLLGIITLGMGGVGYVLSVLDDHSMQVSLAILRFPSWMAFVLLLYTDTIVSGAVTATAFGEVYHGVIGVLVLAVMCLIIVFVSIQLWTNFGGTMVRNAEPLTGWRRILFGTDRWRDSSRIPNARRWESMTLRYEALKGNFILRRVCSAYITQYERINGAVRAIEADPDGTAAATQLGNDVSAGGGTRLNVPMLLLQTAEGGAANSSSGRVVKDRVAKKGAGNDTSIRERNVEDMDAVEDEDLTEESDIELDEETKAAQTAARRRELLLGAVLPAPTGVRGFCKRNKMFFDEYNDRIPHFFAFEFIVTFIVGFLEGMKFGSGKCVFVAITFLVLMTVYLFVILATRPNISRYDNAFAVSGTVSQMAAAATFLAGYWTRDEALLETALILVEIGMYLLILKMILDSMKAVGKFILSFLRNRRRQLERALRRKKRYERRRARMRPPTPEPDPEPEPEPPREPTPEPEPEPEPVVEEPPDEEPPPPPPIPKRERAPKRPEVDGFKLMMDETLRRAMPAADGRRQREAEDVLDAILKAEGDDEVRRVIDLADL